MRCLLTPHPIVLAGAVCGSGDSLVGESDAEVGDEAALQEDHQLGAQFVGARGDPRR